MPPTTIGRRPAATSASISAWARRANSPAVARPVTGRMPEQPVLEPRLLLRRRGAGEHLEARVELQRVGGDGDGVLAALGAQALGDRDRDGGLADAGRAEDREEGQRGGHGA